MKNARLVCVLAIAIMVAVSSPLHLTGASGAETSAPYHPTRGMIVFDNVIPSDLNGSLRAQGADLVAVYPRILVVVVNVESGAIDDVLAEWRSRPDVSYAVRDRYLTQFYVPNDARYSEQWGPPRVGFEVAWDTTTSATGISLAIIDTGVACVHVDIVCNPTHARDTTSCDGHGTWVAGVASAIMNNSVGIAGGANTSRWTLPTTANDIVCVLLLSVVVDSVEYAIDNDADILNLSFGTTGCDSINDCEPLAAALDDAHAAGILLVAAAGNTPDCYQQNPSPLPFPASHAQTIAVSGTKQDDSHYGVCAAGIDIAAPAFRILSTDYGTVNATSYYQTVDGTSFAAPLVSAGAALMMSECPGLNANQIRQIVNDTAEDIGLATNQQGHGLFRADLALAEAIGHDDC